MERRGLSLIIVFPVLLTALLSATAGNREEREAVTTATTAPTETAVTEATAARTSKRVRVPAHRHSRWTHTKVLDRIDGVLIRVEGRRVRIDGATVVCGGQGRQVRNRWRHFLCIQPTIPAASFAGPDAIFRVHVVSRRKFLATNAHFAR